MSRKKKAAAMPPFSFPLFPNREKYDGWGIRQDRNPARTGDGT
jgi:hypothetical protein